MGEMDVHIDALIYLREALKDYFREAPQVYVAGNMLLYYEEGNPAACVAPDVFVVQGVAKHERRIYKLWEEDQLARRCVGDYLAQHTAGRPGNEVGVVCHARGPGVFLV